MNHQEKHDRVFQDHEKALKKALPEGVKLFDGREFLSGQENECDGFYEPRYLIEMRIKFQTYASWYEKQMRRKDREK